MPKDLSDRSIKAEMKKRAPEGKRRFIMDGQVRAFGIAVNERGEASFFLNARYGGARQPARRSLGRVGEITLAEAREKARAWKALLAAGRDPAAEADRERRENDRRRHNTVAAIAEDFIASLPETERKRDEVARDVRREVVGPLGARPAGEVTARDVIDIVRGIKDRGAPHQARNVLGYCRRMFGWAVAQHAYGLALSPCDPIKPKLILGAKKARKRVLEDDELRSVWEGAGAMPYPYGPLFRLLMLTGARKSEIAEAGWAEIDEVKGLLTIPASRMKSDEAHVIPLAPAALEILSALPRFEKRGAYLFSTTAGEKPVNGFSKAKLALDSAAAKRFGRPINAFTIHDLRRTMRTHLSALPIPQHIAERIIGHAMPGLIQTYDRFSFLAEKRQGLEMWADRLMAIVSEKPSPPAGGKVIHLWKAADRATA